MLQAGSARIAWAKRASRDWRSGRLLVVRPRSWLGPAQLLAEVECRSEVAVDQVPARKVSRSRTHGRSRNRERSLIATGQRCAPR